MSFRLVDSGWAGELDAALLADRSSVCIVCPFIKERAIRRLLERRIPRNLQIITRFNLADFYEGVSDTTALQWLLQNGARIRGIRNLHSKLYLFGASRAIVTSANLTDAALVRNHEFGFVAGDAVIIGHCGRYFDDLWSRAGDDLTASRLAQFESSIASVLTRGAPPVSVSGLGDEGADAGISVEPIPVPTRIVDSGQSFVKFFGTARGRRDRSFPVVEQVRDSGCHWACTYPTNKRPRQVQDGAVLFVGRLVKDPADTLIYGRSVGRRYVDGRDDASQADIDLRPWKSKWPHYIRVRQVEFVAGALANGVSLCELMDALGSDSFASTQRNAALGQGNTDPRRAYMQQAAVQLSPEGVEWLNDRLGGAFARFGKIPQSDLDSLDKPLVPAGYERLPDE